MEGRENPANKATNNEELTIKDLILRIQQWIGFLWKKKFVIIFIAILGAGLGLTYSILKKPSYVAELTFVLEDSKGSSLGAYAGIASQFGIDLSGGGGSGIFTGDNILQFLKSRMIIQKTLLSPVTINGHQIPLLELYLSTYEYRKKWEKDTALRKLAFPINPGNIARLTRAQDSVLAVLCNIISEVHLKVEKPDKKLGFISVKCTTENEAFSKAFSEILVTSAANFYINTKTLRAKNNVDKLQAKVDSLQILLNRKTYSAAATQDLNLNPARQVATVGNELAARDKLMLQTIYIEAIKNLEVSKMSMAQETPVIQVVDTPILPLKKEKFGKAKGIVLGGVVGGLLAVIALVVLRSYKDIMNTDH